jgi:hypothetical protein
MYISQEYKAIFFHNPKTAGRSLYKAFGFTEGNGLLNHFQPDWAKEMIFQSSWDQYWKFSFVRNPWDRYVSIYEFHRQSEYIRRNNLQCWNWANNHSFTEWMHLNKNRFIHSAWFAQPQTDWIDGCDAVFKFEELDSAVEIINRHIPMKEVLVHRNKSVHAEYKFYYDRITAQTVADIDKEIIKRFGYKF